MPKATFTLPDGTVVNIDGSAAEIKELMDHFASASRGAREVSQPKLRPRASRARQRRASVSEAVASEAPELGEIVAKVKDCDEAEAIEKQILDRTSQVNRTLLPLYVVHEFFDNRFGLTSGDISKVTVDLGVPVATPNVSRTLSGTAKAYVIGDRTRRQGGTVRYKLSRRGVSYINSVIQGT